MLNDAPNDSMRESRSVWGVSSTLSWWEYVVVVAAIFAFFGWFYGACYRGEMQQCPGSYRRSMCR